MNALRTPPPSLLAKFVLIVVAPLLQRIVGPLVLHDLKQKSERVGVAPSPVAMKNRKTEAARNKKFSGRVAFFFAMFHGCDPFPLDCNLGIWVVFTPPQRGTQVLNLNLWEVNKNVEHKEYYFTMWMVFNQKNSFSCKNTGKTSKKCDIGGTQKKLSIQSNFIEKTTHCHTMPTANY